jgi:hypothetical protein
MAGRVARLLDYGMSTRRIDPGGRSIEPMHVRLCMMLNEQVRMMARPFTSDYQDVAGA